MKHDFPEKFSSSAKKAELFSRFFLRARIFLSSKKGLLKKSVKIFHMIIDNAAAKGYNVTIKTVKLEEFMSNEIIPEKKPLTEEYLKKMSQAEREYSELSDSVKELIRKIEDIWSPWR